MQTWRKYAHDRITINLIAQTSAPGERSSKTAEWLYFFAMSSGVSLSYIAKIKDQGMIASYQLQHCHIAH